LKKHNKLTPRQLLVAGVLLLIFALLTFVLFTYQRKEKRFHALTQELFCEEMCASTLNMHYTLADPEAFGITDYQAQLPLYSAEESSLSQSTVPSLLDTFRSIDEGALPPTDAYTLKLFKRHLETNLALAEFPYYNEPLSPSGGMQTQLPILLAEYTFRTQKDVEDYLALLAQTDNYFASLLQYEQEKAAAGLSQAASSLEKVKRQCDTIVTKEALQSGGHFLQTTFSERLRPLVEQHILTEQDVEKYTAQNDRLLSTVLLPAYIRLADGLFLLEDPTVPLAGLSSKPRGKEYYLQLLRAETGSYREIAEIKSLLQKQFDEELECFRELAVTHRELLAALSAQSSDAPSVHFPLEDPTQMLTDLQTRMQVDFPLLPSSSTETISVKAISPSLESYCAPAFYLTVPVDATENHVIYINKKNAPDGLELYTTLAHEGYPGHLYQTVYTNRSYQDHPEDVCRELLWYGGYLEGWALYVEFLSYDYASALLSEKETDSALLQTEKLLIELEKHSRSLQLCLYSMLDILIHYENGTMEQTANQLSSLGIKNPASVRSLYTYIVEEPCNYMKYYLGYLEILALKEKAKTLWGLNYSEQAFHQFFLDCGPSDFASLEERLEEATVSKK